jgi:hypothetical protein
MNPFREPTESEEDFEAQLYQDRDFDDGEPEPWPNCYVCDSPNSSVINVDCATGERTPLCWECHDKLERRKRAVAASQEVKSNA